MWSSKAQRIVMGIVSCLAVVGCSNVNSQAANGREQSSTSADAPSLDARTNTAQAVAPGTAGESKSQTDSNALQIEAKSWFEKGYALVSAGHDEAAIPAYDRALELDPTNAKAWIYKSAALMRIASSFDPSRQAEAIQCQQKAAELLKPLLAKGREQIETGKFQDALKSFDAVLEADRYNSTAQFGKGRALRSLGRDDEALDAFNGALKSDFSNTEVLRAKGDLLKTLGRNEEADKSYAEADSWDALNSRSPR